MHFSRHIALAAALAFAGPAIAQDTTADTVVATVNGTEITIGHLIVARDRLPDEYRQIPDEVLFKGLIDQLVQQEAMRGDQDTLSKRSELTLENEARALQVGEKIQAAVDEALTEEAIQAAYDARFADAEPEQEYSAAHILVETEEEAQEIISELEGGADFATLAQERSTGPSGPNGGDLGWFSAGMMVPPFEEAVMALEAETVSAPVQTDFGWHVIRLNEVREKAAPTIDQVRGELVQEIQNATVEEILAAATDGAEITRIEEGEIDPSILSTPGLLDD